MYRTRGGSFLLYEDVILFLGIQGGEKDKYSRDFKIIKKQRSFDI